MNGNDKKNAWLQFYKTGDGAFENNIKTDNTLFLLFFNLPLLCIF